MVLLQEVFARCQIMVYKQKKVRCLGGGDGIFPPVGQVNHNRLLLQGVIFVFEVGLPVVEAIGTSFRPKQKYNRIVG